MYLADPRTSCDDRRSRPEIFAERLNHTAAGYVIRAGYVSPLAYCRALSPHPASTDTGHSRGQGRLPCAHYSRHY